jgi:hypothetical protein
LYFCPSLKENFIFFQTKYTLLDERDINLVHDFIFEARTEIDRNGCGAVIFAYAYIYEKGRSQGQYVQDLLWLVVISFYDIKFAYNND